MFPRRLFIAACAGVSLPPTRALAATVPQKLIVPLCIRVAECDGKPVRTDGWVQDHVAAAQMIFAPHAIGLNYTMAPFAPSRCELLTRDDRSAMVTHVVSRTEVNVLVVARVRDLDVPSYDLQGVHWRAQGADPARHWVFLTARAAPPVLAHELCHFFGLPHDPAGGNLMTPGPSSPVWQSPRPPKPFEPRLTHVQASRLRRGVAAWRAHER
ncbi:MAG: hypothetical protein SF187_14255 [Deltaproteobacteria bacterium]|nr:hypothetical protein [Deltaproteobacteria bacterium]